MLNTVIIIDDSEVDRYLASRVLGKAGLFHTVVDITDGYSALDLFSDPAEFVARFGPCPPPVVLMLDINMPGMNGFELLDEISARVSRCQSVEDCIAVTMYTSSSDPADIERSCKHPLVVDYIIKPVTVEAVQRLVERVNGEGIEIERTAH